MLGTSGRQRKRVPLETHANDILGLAVGYCVGSSSLFLNFFS